MSTYKNEANPGQVEIVFARTRGNGTYTMHLQVTEACSRVKLVDVQLNAEQYMALMASGHITIQSEPIKDVKHLGKTMESSYIPYKFDQELQVKKDRQKALVTGKWDTAETRKQNTGWLLVLRRWR